MNEPKIKVVEVKVREMDFEERRKGAKKARMYFFAKGENIIENLTARRFRPKVLYRQVFDEVFEKAGIPKPEKITWNQYAGCRCGCSPAFILDGIYNKNIFVDYEGAQVQPEVQEAFDQFKANLKTEQSVSA